MKFRKSLEILAFILAVNSISLAGTVSCNPIHGKTILNQPQRILESLISQTETVDFPVNKRVRIDAVQTVDRHLTLSLTNSKTKRKLASFQIGSTNPKDFIPIYLSAPLSALLRFKVMQIEGLPSPLIHAVAIQPGGSDCALLSVLIGEVNGQIKILTPPNIISSMEGDVFIGDLDNGLGVGIAAWDFIWGNNESHVDAHNYEFTFYSFDKRKQMFVKKRKVITRQKHNIDREALDELKLSSYRNMLDEFAGLEDYRAIKGKNEYLKEKNLKGSN